MKTYAKIDLFYARDYLCSTNQSKTCREAVEKYLERAQYYKPYAGLLDSQILKNPKLLKARFDKRAR